MALASLKGDLMFSKVTRCAVAGALYFCLFNVLPAAAAEPLGRLQREWWQWAGSIVIDVNPAVDTTGNFCEAGQHGTYWFLSSYPGTTTPTCVVPKGVKLLVPVVVTFCYPEEGFDTDETCMDYISDALVGYLRKDLTVRLDNVRQQTFDVCEVAAAPNDVLPALPPSCVVLRRSNRTLFNFVIGQSGFYLSEPGVWRANAARGIWSVIDTGTLTPGEHRLRIRATGTDQALIPFMDTTYNLVVVVPDN